MTRSRKTHLCFWNIIFGLFAVASCSSYGFQKHEGSAPTNEFTLNQANPDARIVIASSSQIVVVNIEPPTPSHKISLELVAMQLCDESGGDRLKIIYSDPTSIKTEIWKVNVTASTQSGAKELKDIQANQIVLIPEGRWILSGVDLVATLYEDGITCPDNSFSCPCTFRCIAPELECNLQPNCGLGCSADESCLKSSGGYRVSSPIRASCEAPLPTTPSTTTTKQESSTGDSGGVWVKATYSIIFMILVSYVI